MMSLYAANNIAAAIRNFGKRGYARLRAGEIQGTGPEGQDGFPGKDVGLCAPVVRKYKRAAEDRA